MVISMLKIRRPLGRLIFNMGIAIPGKTAFVIETAPRIQKNVFYYNKLDNSDQIMMKYIVLVTKTTLLRRIQEF